MNYNRFITNISAARQPSSIREASKIYSSAPPDSIIFMAGGMPNESTFPFKSFKIELKDDPEVLTIEGKPLDRALQYSVTTGTRGLSDFLKDLMIHVHKLPLNYWETHSLLITTGSVEGICRTIEMCLEEGEPIIFQEPAYSGVLEQVRPYDPVLIPAVEDEYGMCPEKLRLELESRGFYPHNVCNKTSGVPKFLYVNPTGANPSGTLLSLERKKEIYKIARDYDLIILEDDPYYFIHFEKDNPESFLQLDTDDRVIRYDSFSKILSAGMRLGFATGPRVLMERIELHIQVSTIHTSALSQVVAEALLSKWGMAQLFKHISNIKQFYKRQRDVAVEAIEKYLTGLVEWSVPRGGMFLWLRVLGVDDIPQMIREQSVTRGVLLLAGNAFMLDPSKNCQYVRASFSTASPQQLQEGFKRFAMMIKDELKKQEERKK